SDGVVSVGEGAFGDGAGGAGDGEGEGAGGDEAAGVVSDGLVAGAVDEGVDVAVAVVAIGPVRGLVEDEGVAGCGEGTEALAHASHAPRAVAADGGAVAGDGEVVVIVTEARPLGEIEVGVMRERYAVVARNELQDR